jgi:hypothetical protein
VLSDSDVIHFENKALKIISYMEIEEEVVPGFEIVVVDKTGNVCINVTLRCVCVTVVAVQKQ